MGRYSMGKTRAARVAACLMALALLCALAPAAAFQAAEAGPAVEIATAEDFAAISNLSGSYKQTKDITITLDQRVRGNFTGQYDGGGHTLTVLAGTVKLEGAAFGLFADELGSGALVKDLTLATSGAVKVETKDSSAAESAIGGLAGKMGSNARAENIRFTGTLNAYAAPYASNSALQRTFVGGIAGRLEGSAQISGAAVSGTLYAGGTGLTDDGNKTLYSYVMAAGGVAGGIGGSAAISGSSVSGAVYMGNSQKNGQAQSNGSSAFFAGGLAGWADGGSFSENSVAGARLYADLNGKAQPGSWYAGSFGLAAAVCPMLAGSGGNVSGTSGSATCTGTEQQAADAELYLWQGAGKTLASLVDFGNYEQAAGAAQDAGQGAAAGGNTGDGATGGSSGTAGTVPQADETVYSITASPASGSVKPGDTITFTVSPGAELYIEAKAGGDSPVIPGPDSATGAHGTGSVSYTVPADASGTLKVLAAVYVGGEIRYSTSKPFEYNVEAAGGPAKSAFSANANAVQVQGAGMGVMAVDYEPQAEPSSGLVKAGDKITISTTPATAIVYLNVTTNGNDPAEPKPGTGNYTHTGTGSVDYTVSGTIGTLKIMVAVYDGSDKKDATTGPFSYTITTRAATPTLSPGSSSDGTPMQPGKIIIIQTTETGGTIHYTVNGGTPASHVGTSVTIPITDNGSGSCTISAFVRASGKIDSDKLDLSYPIMLPYATTDLPANGYVWSGKGITIIAPAGYPDASLQYAFGEGSYNDYTGTAIPLTGSVGSELTLKIKASKAGYEPSVTTVDYTIALKETPVAGSVLNPLTDKIVLETKVPGAKVYYTIKVGGLATPPDSTSLGGTSKVEIPLEEQFGKSLQVRAAVYTNDVLLNDAVYDYTLVERSAMPTVDIAPDDTNGILADKTVSLSSVDGAKIYYTFTTDGTEPAVPTPNSPNVINSGESIKIKDGGTSGKFNVLAVAVEEYGSGKSKAVSEILKLSYTIKLPQPTADPASGEVGLNSIIKLSVPGHSTDSVKLYYVAGDELPTTSSASGSRVTVQGMWGTPFKIRAMATKTNYVNSDVKDFIYSRIGDDYSLSSNIDVSRHNYVFPKGRGDDTRSKVAITTAAAYKYIYFTYGYYDTPDVDLLPDPTTTNYNGAGWRSFSVGVEEQYGKFLIIKARVEIDYYSGNLSDTTTFIYEVATKASEPEATPNQGVLGQSDRVTLSSPDNGEIYYVIVKDASDTTMPQKTSNYRYTPGQQLAIPTNKAVLRAMVTATSQYKADSDVVEFTYTSVQLPPPAARPSSGQIMWGSSVELYIPPKDYPEPQNVNICYSTDPNKPKTEWTEGNSVLMNGEPDGTMTIWAYSKREGAVSSSDVSFTYTLVAADQTISALPESGATVRPGEQILLTAAMPDATIYYSTDGNLPTLSSPSGIGSVAVTVSGSPGGLVPIKAMVVMGTIQSKPVSFSYTIMKQTPPPFASIPTGAVLLSGAKVELSAAEGKVYYTTDGTTPTTSSRMYTEPLSLTVSTVVKAIAAADDKLPSAVAEFTYNLAGSVQAPVASVASGQQVEPGTTVTISSGTAGATIYYTTNGVEPVAGNTMDAILYDSPITVSRAVTIKAIAVKEGLNPSAAATFAYTVTEKVVEAPAGEEEGTLQPGASDKLFSFDEYAGIGAQPKFDDVRSDSATLVVLSAPAGSLPDDTRLEVTQFPSPSAADREAVDRDLGWTLLVEYDVTLWSGGAQIQPPEGTSVEVGLPLPSAASDAIVAMVHINDRGQVEVLDTRRGGGTIYAETTSLSRFGVAVPKVDAADGSAWSQVLIPILVGMASAAVVVLLVVLVRRRRGSRLALARRAEADEDYEMMQRMEGMDRDEMIQELRAMDEADGTGAAPEEEAAEPPGDEEADAPEAAQAEDGEDSPDAPRDDKEEADEDET